MDEWANPLVATALLTSRDGTMESGATNDQSLLKDKGAPPAKFSDPEQLLRWDPWVRVNVAVTELTRALDYVPDTALGTFSVRYGHDAQAKVLVTMSRPDLPFFVAQLPFVHGWGELRDERLPEILAQIDNQFAFIAAATGLHVTRKRWTMEWLTVVIQLTIAVELMFKHAFACYRPVELSPQVQPIITTPGHGTYPMGHAAQSFATAVAFAGLLKVARAHAAWIQLYRQARRISVNRVVAGTHFPIDAAAGQALGLTLGEYVLCASSIAGASCFKRTFAPTGKGDDAANDYLGDGPLDPQGCKTDTVSTPIAMSPVLKKMAEMAQAEWQV